MQPQPRRLALPLLSAALALAVALAVAPAGSQEPTKAAAPAAADNRDKQAAPPASDAPATPLPAAAAPGADAPEPPPYKVVDGDKVDEHTFAGWKVWRAMACERCHGATQDGLVGPSLNHDLKTMSKDDFVACVLAGRIEKGMPNFGSSDMVLQHIDDLYAYLKGRSDGAIKPGHVHVIGKE